MRLPHALADAGRLHHLLGFTGRLRSASSPARDVGTARPQDPEQFKADDLLYSFGIAHPGAIRLHNFPKHLQALVKDNGEQFDLATVDVLRDRERGVPRYNRFRRLLHKPPVNSFEELTDNPQWAAELRRVYDNDLEKVDSHVGLMAEPLPRASASATPRSASSS